MQQIPADLLPGQHVRCLALSIIRGATAPDPLPSHQALTLMKEMCLIQKFFSRDLGFISHGW